MKKIMTFGLLCLSINLLSSQTVFAASLHENTADCNDCIQKNGKQYYKVLTKWEAIKDSTHYCTRNNDKAIQGILKDVKKKSQGKEDFSKDYGYCKTLLSGACKQQCKI